MAPKYITCTHCDYRNEHGCNVKSHMIRIHKIKIPKIHKCKFCNQMYPTLFEMKAHMGNSYCSNTNIEFARKLQEKFSQRRYHQCLKCNYRSWVRANVARHMTDKHNIVEPKLYKCKYCACAFHKHAEHLDHLHNCERKKEATLSKKPASDNSHYVIISKRLKGTCIMKSVRVEKITNRRKRKVELKMVDCLHCNYKSKYPSNIRSHMKAKHGVAIPKVNKCEHCGKYFQSSYVLRSHIAKICGKVDKSQGHGKDLKKPRKINKKIGTANEVEPFSCSTCGYQSNQAGHIRNHMKRVHGILRSKIYKCKICGELYENQALLKNHDESHEVKVDNGTNEMENEEEPTMPQLFPVDYIINQRSLENEYYPMFYCFHCDKVFKNDEELQMHTEQAHENDYWSSPPSDIEEYGDHMQDSSELKIIESKEDLKRLYDCLMCSYKSKYSNHIRSHMKNMHGVANPKINKCEFCLDYFRNAFVLKTHMVTCEKNTQKLHTAMRQYKPRKGLRKGHNCKYCKKTFKSYLELRIHKKKTHANKNSEDGIEIFKCTKCDYGSLYTCSVRSHMKLIHNIVNPKIHRCKFCGEMFQNLYQLKSHMRDDFCTNTNKDFAVRSKEAEKKKWHYNCSKCSYRASYVQCFKSHLATKHKIRKMTFYKCDLCREIFIGKNQHKMHICKEIKNSGKNYHRKRNYNKKFPAKHQIYICQTCDEVFDHKRTFDSHQKSIICFSVSKENPNDGKTLFGKPLLFPRIKIERINLKGLEGLHSNHSNRVTVSEMEKVKNKRRAWQTRKKTDTNASKENALLVKEKFDANLSKKIVKTTETEQQNPKELIRKSKTCNKSDSDLICISNSWKPEVVKTNKYAVSESMKSSQLYYLSSNDLIPNIPCPENSLKINHTGFPNEAQEEEVSVVQIVSNSEILGQVNSFSFEAYPPNAIFYVDEESQKYGQEIRKNEIDIYACYDDDEDEDSDINCPAPVADDTIDINFDDPPWPWDNNDTDTDDVVIIKEEVDGDNGTDWG